MNPADVIELEKRSMSTWTAGELRQYSIATGQACPKCELEIGSNETVTKCPDYDCPMLQKAGAQ